MPTYDHSDPNDPNATNPGAASPNANSNISGNAYTPCPDCGWPRGGSPLPCPICGHDPAGAPVIPPPHLVNIAPGGKFPAMPAAFDPYTTPAVGSPVVSIGASDAAVDAAALSAMLEAMDDPPPQPFSRRDRAAEAFAADVRSALDVALGPEPTDPLTGALLRPDPTDAATRWPDARRAWDGLQAALDLLMTAADPATGGRMTRLGEYALSGPALDDAYQQAALVGAWLVIFQSALAKRADAAS